MYCTVQDTHYSCQFEAQGEDNRIFHTKGFPIWLHNMSKLHSGNFGMDLLHACHTLLACTFLHIGRWTANASMGYSKTYSSSKSKLSYTNPLPIFRIRYHRRFWVLHNWWQPFCLSSSQICLCKIPNVFWQTIDAWTALIGWCLREERKVEKPKCERFSQS